MANSAREAQNASVREIATYILVFGFLFLIYWRFRRGAESLVGAVLFVGVAIMFWYLYRAAIVSATF
jgi:hypothetical protein